MNNSKEINWKKVSAIILSAGKSERIKFPKAFLRFNSNFSFLGHLLSTYEESNLREIVVVLNKDIEDAAGKILFPFSRTSNVTRVINNHPEKGRFNSIRFASYVLNRKSPAFIQNIDSPFITHDLIEQMISKLQKGSYVAPVCNERRGHPVLLSPEILDHIRKIKDTDTNLRDILKLYKCIELETTDDRIHANINTEAEYRKYFLNEKIGF